MYFTFLFAIFLFVAPIFAADIGPVEPRQTAGTQDLLFLGICSERFVRCEQALGEAGKGLCCRNGNLCSQNGTIVTCADGTVARPFQTDDFPSFASFIRTASPAAYTSFLGGITGNPVLPSSLVNAVTGGPVASETESEGAAPRRYRAPTTGAGSGNIMVILGVWVTAAVAGAAWLFAH